MMTTFTRTDDEMGIAARTPNGREVRRTESGKFVVQPHNDNYWIECDSVDEALFKFAHPHDDYTAPTTATELAQRIVDSWESEWSIQETARIGLSDADLDACNDLAAGDEALAVAISLEVERICRERSS